MGYTTDFTGCFTLSRPATEKEINYINTFSKTRRMKRDVNKLMEMYEGEHGHPTPKSNDPKDIYGNDGEYFALDDGQNGQTHDASIIDYNTPPGQLTYDETKHLEFNVSFDQKMALIKSGMCQPGLWCQWELSPDGVYLEWDGGEKFYYYTEWVKYLIKHFFEPWGIKLNGEVSWNGEDSSDIGKIVITDNVVKTQIGHITYIDE